MKWYRVIQSFVYVELCYDLNTWAAPCMQVLNMTTFPPSVSEKFNRLNINSATNLCFPCVFLYQGFLSFFHEVTLLAVATLATWVNLCMQAMNRLRACQGSQENSTDWIQTARRTSVFFVFFLYQGFLSFFFVKLHGLYWRRRFFFAKFDIDSESSAPEFKCERINSGGGREGSL